MSDKQLIYYSKPKLQDARLVIGLTGWMDGGDVSTGTIEYLVEQLAAETIAEIEPAPFYLYNFPGSMEIASLFRPHVSIEGGLIKEFGEPANVFYCNRKQNLLLFSGKEPNLGWPEYAGCIYDVIETCGVTEVYFVGSVAGLTPHTREPRFYSTVSAETLLPLLATHSLIPSNYEGPASFVTFLMAEAQRRGLPMATLVAEIPGYVDGRNAICIESTVRKLAEMLAMDIDASVLQRLARDLSERLNATVKTTEGLPERIAAMEREYDEEQSGEDTDDLRDWFEKQNIRLD